MSDLPSSDLPHAVQTALIVAEDMANSGDYTGAADWLTETQAMYPDNHALRVRLAKYLISAFRFSEAASQLLSVLPSMPDNESLIVAAVDALNKAGQFALAKELCSRYEHVLGEGAAAALAPWDSLYIQHYGEDIVSKRPFYNLGAGVWRHWAWKNIDLVHPNYPHNTPDVVHDLMEEGEFSLESNSARLFFTSHCLEHIPQSACIKALSEMFRVLEPGGCLRISVPDTALAYKAYLSGDRDYFLYSWPICKELSWDDQNTIPLSSFFVATFATYMSYGGPDFNEIPKLTSEELDTLIADKGLDTALDDICQRIPLDYQRRYPNAHLNWFTFEKLKSLLTAAGFVDVECSTYGRSRVPVMRDVRFFDATWPFGSLYVEAIKPK